MAQNLKAQVKDIFKRYCGVMTVSTFGHLWEELFNIGIEGIPARFRFEEPYPNYFKVCAPLQLTDGSETDFKVVIAYDRGENNINNYTLYVA